jgi:flagellar motor protein MotB
MTFRFPLLLAAAAALLIAGTGCESSKTKAQINSLLSQNRELQQKLDAESAARTAAEARAQAATEAAARAPAAAMTPDMGPGPLVDLRGPGARTPRGGGATVVPPALETPAAAADTVLELKGDVLFDSGTATLKSTAQKELDALAAQIKKQYAGRTLRIEGHTDATPLKSTSKYKSNKELGEARARAVMSYLSKKGIPATDMKAVSFGASQPKSTRDQSQNRRVEIVVERS